MEIDFNEGVLTQEDTDDCQHIFITGRSDNAYAIKLSFGNDLTCFMS